MADSNFVNGPPDPGSIVGWRGDGAILVFDGIEVIHGLIEVEMGHIEMPDGELFAPQSVAGILAHGSWYDEPGCSDDQHVAPSVLQWRAEHRSHSQADSVQELWRLENDARRRRQAAKRDRRRGVG